MPSTKTFNKSIFKRYFEYNDANVLAWAENVLNKISKGNAAPKYLIRDDQDLSRSTDFSDTFRPVTVFFAYFVILARQFENFKDNSYLSDKYLLNKGQYTCGDEELDQLLYLIQNSINVRAKRGGLGMMQDSFYDSNTEDSDSSLGSSVKGELLRLLCDEDSDFFKLGVAKPEFNSHNTTGNNFEFRGVTGRYDLNLAYENTEDVLDLSSYPLINEAYVDVVSYQGKEVIEIEGVPIGEVSGIGADVESKRIVIDPDLNFEITFQVSQDITRENITFGCRVFDIDGNELSMLSIETGANWKNFFETRRLNHANKLYLVRGIIYNRNKDLLSEEEAKLNIGFGRNLKFPEGAVSIIPYVVMDNNFGDDSDSESDTFDSESESWTDSYDSDPSIYIWNLKVTPIIPHARCYIDNKRFIDVIAVNNNGRNNLIQLKDILRRYFIPYNTAFEVVYLPLIPSSGGTVGSFILLEDGFYLLDEEGFPILTEDGI